MDDHHRQTGTDRNDGLWLLGRVLPADRSHEGRGDQVHAFHRETGPLDGFDHPAHEVGVCGGDQDPAHFGAFGGGVVGEDLRRQDGLIGRERDDLFRLEPNRILHFAVGDEGEIDLASDRTQSRDAHDDRGPAELTVLPELGDGFRHGGTVPDLAVDEGPGRQANLTVGDQGWTEPADIEFRSANGAGPDVEADRQLCHERTSGALRDPCPVR